MSGYRAFFVLCLALLLMGPPQATLPLVAQDALPLVESLSGENKRDFELYSKILSGQAYPLNLRRTAAIRLLQRGWPQGINAMLTILADSENSLGRLAVAQALAEALPELDPQPKGFVEPLLSDLSAKDERLRQASALALAHYSTAVLPQLGRMILQPDPQTTEATRLAAVVAVERIKDKKSAQILIDALNDQNSQLAARSRQGLEHLTGISFADDHVAWRRWWQQYKDKPLTEWLRLYLLALESQNRQLRTDLKLLRERLTSQIQARWESAQDQPKFLSELLRDPLEDLRLQGLHLARDLLAGSFPEKLGQQIRGMVTDSSGPVRASAGLLLRDLRDAQAEKIILEQLAQETDPKVRASLANALGYLGGAEAVQTLIDHLADPAPVVVGEAAGALGKLAVAEEVVHLRAGIVQALLDRYQTSAGPNGAGPGLRSKLLSAMAQIGSVSFRPLFFQALEDSSALTRAVAVEGLRKLPTHNRLRQTLAAVRPLLADPDPGVRLEVLRAIADLADVAELEDLQKRLDPKIEPDPDVRQEVWAVIITLLNKADLKTLEYWQRKTVLAGDNDRHEQVLRILEGELLQSQAGPIRLIAVREKLGDCLVLLNRHQAASVKYRLAYEQARTVAVPNLSPVQARLALKLLNALLNHGAFDQAAEHLKTIANSPSGQEKQALTTSLDYLHGLLAEETPAGNIDLAVELIAALQAADLPGLSQQPLAQRMKNLETTALDLQGQADKELVLANVDRLSQAGTSPEVLAEAGAAIGKLGLLRAGKHLLDELDRLLASDQSDSAREKALVDLLAALNPAFSGYDLQVSPEQRRSVLAGWQALLAGREP